MAMLEFGPRVSRHFLNKGTPGKSQGVARNRAAALQLVPDPNMHLHVYPRKGKLSSE